MEQKALGKDLRALVKQSNGKLLPPFQQASNALASDSVHIMPRATLYRFYVLASIVHMAWMRVV